MTLTLLSTCSAPRQDLYCDSWLVSVISGAHSKSQETRNKSDSSAGEVYYTRERIERFVIGIIVLMILVLLVIPIYLLYHFTDNSKNLHGDLRGIGILLAFTLAFSACISLFTRKRQLPVSCATEKFSD